MGKRRKWENQGEVCWWKPPAFPPLTAGRKEGVAAVAFLPVTKISGAESSVNGSRQLAANVRQNEVEESCLMARTEIYGT